MQSRVVDSRSSFLNLDLSRQFTPFILHANKIATCYKQISYIRTDGLKFTRYWLIIVSLKLLILWLRKNKSNKSRVRTNM